MKNRERILAAAVGLLAGAWLLDSLLISPGLAWYGAVQEETLTSSRAVDEAKILIDRSERIEKDWRGHHAAGLLDDEDTARFRVQQTLAASARSGGFTLDSVGGGQRIPASQGQIYDLIRLSITGQGSLAEAQAFLAGLESAAQALRLERCELAARDARRDQVDLALTVSTRIAGKSARESRRIPAGTVAWKPDSREGKTDAAILAAKPFLADRRATTFRPATTTSEERPVSPPGWVLVGIVARVSGAEAFLRNLQDGSERIVHPGDTVPDGCVVFIDQNGLHLDLHGEMRLIAVGCNLEGQVMTITRSTPSASATVIPSSQGSSGVTAPTASPAAPVATPLHIPALPPDPERDAILQRLRQQRNRSR